MLPIIGRTPATKAVHVSQIASNEGKRYLRWMKHRGAASGINWIGSPGRVRYRAPYSAKSKFDMIKALTNRWGLCECLPGYKKEWGLCKAQRTKKKKQRLLDQVN